MPSGIMIRNSYAHRKIYKEITVPNADTHRRTKLQASCFTRFDQILVPVFNNSNIEDEGEEYARDEMHPKGISVNA